MFARIFQTLVFASTALTIAFVLQAPLYRLAEAVENQHVKALERAVELQKQMESETLHQLRRDPRG